MLAIVFILIPFMKKREVRYFRGLYKSLGMNCTNKAGLIISKEITAPIASDTKMNIFVKGLSDVIKSSIYIIYF